MLVVVGLLVVLRFIGLAWPELDRPARPGTSGATSGVSSSTSSRSKLDAMDPADEREETPAPVGAHTDWPAGKADVDFEEREPITARGWARHRLGRHAGRRHRRGRPDHPGRHPAPGDGRARRVPRRADHPRALRAHPADGDHPVAIHRGTEPSVEPVPVADAVAASAAFPLLLPQLNRTYTFTRTDGTQHTRTMLMTDGGVYDNLGLSPLLPGRSLAHTSHVHDLEYLIAVDAGAGRNAPPAPNFWLGRIRRTFDIVHTRSQDALRARVHDVSASADIKGFVHCYLGMRDANLPVPVPDLVDRQTVMSYPTNFATMSPGDLDALTTRAEQLTRVLIDSYCPALGR